MGRLALLVLTVASFSVATTARTDPSGSDEVRISVGSPHAAAGDDSIAWNLDPQLLDALTRSAERYSERRAPFVSVESVRRTRYRHERPGWARERGAAHAHLPGGGLEPTDLRFELGRRRLLPFARPVRGPVRGFPSADAWAKIFSSELRAGFMFRDLGVRVVGFDLVREIEFRGWMPFAHGRDVREWEGVASVELPGLRLVEVRARPRNQDARMAALYGRWARAFKITLGFWSGPFFWPLKTFRLARPPLVFDALVRFDARVDGLRLPSLLRYETRRLIGPAETARRSISVRRYDRYRRFTLFYSPRGAA
jgi:hypothetical protein